MDLTTKDTLTVKEFAKTFDIKQLHEQFYLNKENNHETFNQAFSKLKAQLKALGKEDYFRSQFDVNPQGTRRELVHTAIWDKAQDGDKWAILLLERLGCLD